MTYKHTCRSNTNVYIGISSRMMEKSRFCLVNVQKFCFVLHIGSYNIAQMAKRCASPVFALNLQNMTKHSTVSLCYLYNINIFQYVSQNSTLISQDKIHVCSTSSFLNLYQCIHWYRKDMYV